MWRFWAVVAVLFASTLPLLAQSDAALPGPLNDLLALGQAGGQTPAPAPIY